MSDYGEYKMKSMLVEDVDAKAKYLLDQIVKHNILEFHFDDETSITGTCCFTIAGEQPGFNSMEEFHLYDVNNNEWVMVRYDDIVNMEHISLVE